MKWQIIASLASVYAYSASVIERLRGNPGGHRMELILAELEEYIEQVDLTLQDRNAIAHILEKLREAIYTAL